MTKDYDKPMDADRKRAHAGRMFEHLSGVKFSDGGVKTYDKLSEALAARQKEWDPSDHLSLLFFAVELAGECGEACNVVKKLEREALGLPGSRSTLQALAEELADVVMTSYNLARRAGIDLDAAIEVKFNETSEKRGFKTRYERR